MDALPAKAMADADHNSFQLAELLARINLLEQRIQALEDALK